MGLLAFLFGSFVTPEFEIVGGISWNIAMTTFLMCNILLLNVS